MASVPRTGMRRNASEDHSSFDENDLESDCNLDQDANDIDQENLDDGMNEINEEYTRESVSPVKIDNKTNDNNLIKNSVIKVSPRAQLVETDENYQICQENESRMKKQSPIDEEIGLEKKASVHGMNENKKCRHLPFQK